MGRVLGIFFLLHLILAGAAGAEPAALILDDRGGRAPGVSIVAQGEESLTLALELPALLAETVEIEGESYHALSIRGGAMRGKAGQAGLPTLTRVFSQRQLGRITFMWIVATATGGFVFPALAHETMAVPWNLAMVVVSFWLAAKSTAVLRPPANQQGPAFRRAFIHVNVYALLGVTFLSLNALGIARR